MADPQLRPKFLRSFFATPATPSVNGSMLYFLRVVYEFWNFCVNGTDDLQRPGGVSTSHTTGSYINMPVGWESGSTVLRASGSDGATFAGTTLFSSTLSNAFSASYKGMYLTIWQSGSTSTDDSIYPIVEWVNSSSIMIDPTYGGTVIGSTGSIPQMTSRSNLNYRVINYAAAATMSPPTVGYVVYQFNGAADVNPGQRNSQFKLSSQVNSVYWDDLRIRMSPSGSWDGTQFVGSFENSSDVTVDGNFGPGGGGWASLNFFHAAVGSTGYITIIADKSFIIAQTGGNWEGYGAACMFTVEIPKRLYPQQMDPNPICAVAYGSMPVQVIASQGYGWAARSMPSPYDTTMRRYQGAMPCYTGWQWERTIHGSTYAPQGLASSRYPLFQNTVTNVTYLPPTTLYLGYFYTQDNFAEPSVQGKTSIGRVRLRSQRTVTGGYQRLARINDGTNKWIHIGAGVLWPWDNALVPTRHLFRGC